MDYLSHPPEMKVPQPHRFLAGLHIFDGIFKWLAGLLRMTEEEQEAAGIYLGDEGYE